MYHVKYINYSIYKQLLAVYKTIKYTYVYVHSSRSLQNLECDKNKHVLSQVVLLVTAARMLL